MNTTNPNPKDVALWNILVMLDTSHSDRSLLNEAAPANIALMLVMLDTSHFERSPLKKARSREHSSNDV